MTVANRSLDEPRKRNFLYRGWNAIKEEHSPIVRFLMPKTKQGVEEKPLLVQIEPELARLFNNDKQINDALRRFSEQQPKDNVEEPLAGG